MEFWRHLRASLICSIVEKETIYLRTDDPQNPQELIQTSPLVEKSSCSADLPA